VEFNSRINSVIFGILFCFVANPARAALTKPAETQPQRKLIKPTKKSKSDGLPKLDETAIINEEHSLYELIDADESANLILKHPSIAMNAAQRVASWINYKEPRTIRDPEFGDGTVTYYPVFSGGIPETGGKRITGQHEAIQAFVDHVKAAARGDGSANKMLLFVGPAGTGKTYFLNILSDLAENLTARNPDYFTYTYEWKDLKKYSSLYSVVNIQQSEDGKSFEHPFKCPINESPLNLIPDEFESEIVKTVTPKVMKMAKVKPTPRRYHCPHCNFIRTEILKQYMEDHKEELSGRDNHSLEPEEVVAALAPHVRIKRMVVGSNGTMAKLDAEPKDVDFQGLTTAPNAFVFHSFGQSHPMSYYLSGKILQANGSLLMFDEFFRDDKGLRDQALNLIENHQVVRGGAPAVQLDTLVIGASNKESVEDAEKNETAKAHIDRTRRVRMPYLLNPVDEATNLLMMKNIKTVRMQKIGSSSATASADDSALPAKSEAVQANLDELFPLPEGSDQRVGPDHRYKLWFDVGPGIEPIHLSPHTLMYVAMVVSGSRLVVDPKKALDFGERQVINDVAYRDIYTRLQILMGQYTINASDLKDLRSLSRDQREGDSGISERDAANVWLTKAILEAQKEENANCLTPDLAHRTFLRLLEDGAIYYPDNKARIHWTKIADELVLKFLVPAIQNDVSTALGSGLGAVNSMYDEIFQEILALSGQASATTYKSKSGEARPINRERLAEIEKLYAQLEKQAFSPQEVVLVFATNSSSPEKRRHPGLLRAVTAYLAQRETDKLTFDDLLRFADTQEGTSEVREKHSELSHVMAHQLGYCKKCLKAALMIARQAKSRTSQVR